MTIARTVTGGRESANRTRGTVMKSTAWSFLFATLSPVASENATVILRFDGGAPDGSPLDNYVATGFGQSITKTMLVTSPSTLTIYDDKFSLEQPVTLPSDSTYRLGCTCRRSSGNQHSSILAINQHRVRQRFLQLRVRSECPTPRMVVHRPGSSLPAGRQCRPDPSSPLPLRQACTG